MWFNIQGVGIDRNAYCGLSFVRASRPEALKGSSICICYLVSVRIDDRPEFRREAPSFAATELPPGIPVASSRQTTFRLMRRGRWTSEEIGHWNADLAMSKADYKIWFSNFVAMYLQDWCWIDWHDVARSLAPWWRHKHRWRSFEESQCLHCCWRSEDRLLVWTPMHGFFSPLVCTYQDQIAHSIVSYG